MLRTFLLTYVLPVLSFMQNVNRNVFKYIVAPLIYSIVFAVLGLLALRFCWQRQLLSALGGHQNVNSAWNSSPVEKSIISRRILQIKHEDLYPASLGGKQRILLQYAGNSLSDTTSLLFLLHENNVPFHGSMAFNQPRYEDLILNGSIALVHWDQTGMGLNYGVRRNAMDEMVKDFKIILEGVVQQVNYIVSLELDEDKDEMDAKLPVHVMGVGSGNLLGVKFIEAHPELVDKYFAVSGLIGNWDEVDGAVWSHHHDSGVDESLVLTPLERMGPPPYVGPLDQQFNDHIHLRMIAMRNGGMFGNQRREGALSHYVKHTFLDLFQSPDYSLVSLWFMLWIKNGQSWLWPDMRHLDFAKQVQHLDCPIIFLHGKADWFGAPIEHVRRWFERVDAPGKKFFEFEKSGYLLFIEERHRFQKILLNEIARES